MDFLVYILSTLMGYMCFVIPKRNISKQPTPKKKPIKIYIIIRSRLKPAFAKNARIAK
jgi:hypothetical protein